MNQEKELFLKKFEDLYNWFKNHPEKIDIIRDELIAIDKKAILDSKDKYKYQNFFFISKDERDSQGGFNIHFTEPKEYIAYLGELLYIGTDEDLSNKCIHMPSEYFHLFPDYFQLYSGFIKINCNLEYFLTKKYGLEIEFEYNSQDKAYNTKVSKTKQLDK